MRKVEAYIQEQAESQKILCSCGEHVELRPEPRLPFPTEKVMGPYGKVVEHYLIPEENRRQILEELYPFSPLPDMEAVMFDLHEERTFVVKEYWVVRHSECNWLASPYYCSHGGTVIDWIPKESDLLQNDSTPGASI